MAVVIIAIISSCNPFPFENSDKGGAIWSDDDNSILYYKVSYTQSDFMAIDSSRKWDPEFTLYTINPDNTGKTALGASKKAWPETMYYMKSADYVIYNYFGGEVGDMAISLYRLSTEEDTILVPDAEPFDSEHIRVVPSPDGRYLAFIEPEFVRDGLYGIPVINLIVRFVDPVILEDLSVWNGLFEEYYEYRWDSDITFHIKDYAAWDEDSGIYTGYKIEPVTGVGEPFLFDSDYPDLPETSSSPVSADGLEVSIDESGLVFTPFM